MRHGAMRIRFFNAYDTVAPLFRNLIPYLAASDVQLEVVMSKAKYRLGDDFEQTVSGLKNVKTVWTLNLGVRPKNSLTKLWIMGAYLIHATVYALFGPNVDRNVFLTQPPLVALLGYILARLRGQPYACIVMDIYPDLAVELGMMNRANPWVRMLSWLSRTTLRNAETVIVIGRCMAKRVRSMGVSPERIHLIPNWADERVVYPVGHDENRLRQEQGWEDHFVALYAGNIGVPQYFDDILALAAEMRDNQKKVIFAFIGEGSRSKETATRVRRHNLTNVVLLPFLHETYPLSDVLSAGDVHFVPLKEAITGLAVPSKSYSIMAAGRPMIYQGGEDGEIARMIQEEDIGQVVHCGDVAGLRKSMLQYLEQPQLAKCQGEKARSLAESRYSRTHALERYAALLVNHTDGVSP